MKEWYLQLGKGKKKEKKKIRYKAKLQVVFSPQVKDCLIGGLGLGTHQTKFKFELTFPSNKIHLTMIKDDTISSYPDDPASYNSNLSEDGAVKVCSGLKHHVKRTKVQVPIDWDCLPTLPAEWALEEKVEACFFTICITQDTTIIIKPHIFPFQDIPCTQSVS